MTTSIILAAIWVLAATGVAMLPMRLQFPFGSVLLVAAFGVVGFLGYEHGIWAALIGLAGFVSMFRNPLRFYWGKWMGTSAKGDEE